MSASSVSSPAASSDALSQRRLKMLTVAMKRHQHRQDALIEVLHTAQELYGYLDPELLRFVARQMKLPPSRVYGVATFYHLFTLKPAGEHTCVVCTGTACYVKGADRLLDAVTREAEIAAGETSSDGMLSLLTARCVGACGNAPVAILDGQVVGSQTPQDLAVWVKGCLSDGSGTTE